MVQLLSNKNFLPFSYVSCLTPQPSLFVRLGILAGFCSGAYGCLQKICLDLAVTEAFCPMPSRQQPGGAQHLKSPPSPVSLRPCSECGGAQAVRHRLIISATDIARICADGVPS